MLNTKTKDSILYQLSKIPKKMDNDKSAINIDVNEENEPLLVDIDDDINIFTEEIQKITEYSYLGDEFLDPSMPESGLVYVIYYRVITSALQPFLCFDMVAREKNVSIPMVDILSSSWKPTNGEYQGYYVSKGKTYIFVNMKDTYEVELYSVKKNMISCTVDDICNSGKIYDLFIDKQTRDFFLQNDQFVRLNGPNGELIDTPLTGYFGSYWKRIAVTAALGPFVMSPYASLGPYYYFGTFESALRYAVIDPSKGEIGKSKSLVLTHEDTDIFTKGGIVKFILFLGRTKVLLNRSSDVDDDSEFTLGLAENNKFVDATLKIRDNDGKWTKNYDSVIVTAYPSFSKLEQTRDLEPQIVLKSFSQQAPISYVYIDTSKIKPIEDDNVDSYIFNKYTFDKATLL